MWLALLSAFPMQFMITISRLMASSLSPHKVLFELYYFNTFRTFSHVTSEIRNQILPNSQHSEIWPWLCQIHQNSSSKRALITNSFFVMLNNALLYWGQCGAAKIRLLTNIAKQRPTIWRQGIVGQTLWILVKPNDTISAPSFSSSCMVFGT